MERAASALTAAELLAVPGLSRNALCSVARLLRRADAQQATSMLRNHQAISRQLEGDFGHLLRTIPLHTADGGRFDWPITPVQTLLLETLARRDMFRTRFAEALALHPNTKDAPWHLAFYTDEITPGNVLRPDNKRKMAVIHVSFLELGQDFLQAEEAWLCIGVIRSSIAKKLLGKEGALFRAIFETLYLGPESVTVAGIPVDVGNGPRLLYVVHACAVYDEAAEKAVWDVKGASGNFPCLDCRNVTALQGGLPMLADCDATGYLVSIACADADKFDPMSDELMWETYDHLVSHAGAAGAAERETACGIGLNPHGVLACRALRAHVKPSSSHRDPMHIMLCNGVFQWELYALLHAMQSNTGLRVEDVLAFCNGLDFRGARARRVRTKVLQEVLNARRTRASMDAKSWKCGASEALAVYPAIRFFVETVLEQHPSLQLRCAPFCTLCDIIDLTQEAKRGVAPWILNAIRVKARAFLTLTQAEGSQHVRPKHHYLVCRKFLQFAEEYGLWLDCFVTERKGIWVKGSMEHTDNTSSFERSVALGFLARTFGAAQQEEDCLLTGTAPAPAHLAPMLGVPAALLMVGTACRSRNTSVGVGDVVFLRNAARQRLSTCIVEVCAFAGGSIVVLETLHRVGAATRSWTRFRQM